MSQVSNVNDSAVKVIEVPKVGDHVWFVSEDELTAGSIFDGEVVEVTLSLVKVNVRDPYVGGIWVLSLNYKIYFSYESLLEEMVKNLRLENYELRKALKLV